MRMKMLFIALSFLIVQLIVVTPVVSAQQTESMYEEQIEHTEYVPSVTSASPTEPVDPKTLEQVLSDENVSQNATDSVPSQEVEVVSPPIATSQYAPKVVDTSLTVRQQLPPPDGPVYVSMFEFHQTKGFQFVELWNTSSEYQKLDNIAVMLEYYDASSLDGVPYACQLPLTGYIAPKSYVTFAQADLVNDDNGAYPINGCQVSGVVLTDATVSVVMLDQSNRVDEKLLLPAAASTIGDRYIRKATAKTGDMADFTRKAATTTIPAEQPRTSRLYMPPDNMQLQITEIFPNPLLCASGDADARCHSYVKVVNNSDEQIDLARYRLRSGSPQAKASVYNTSSLKGVVAPHEFAIILRTADDTPLAMNDDEGATWFEDMLGMVTYPNADTPYEKASLVAQKGRAWAYDPVDMSWKWANPSPKTKETLFYEAGMGSGEVSTEEIVKPCPDGQYRAVETNRCRLLASTTTEWAPCKDGQYRSEQTNRCRSLALAGSTLQPCKDGQYRSEETNRCRSIAATVASTLKPCADDQFRSPETNRCKKIASTEDGLKPCKPGQERSLETNRCRKVLATTVPQAAFAVRPVASTAQDQAKWWALGGVLAIAATYGVWQFRHEVVQLFRKIPYVQRMR